MEVKIVYKIKGEGYRYHTLKLKRNNIDDFNLILDGLSRVFNAPYVFYINIYGHLKDDSTNIISVIFLDEVK